MFLPVTVTSLRPKSNHALRLFVFFSNEDVPKLKGQRIFELVYLHAKSP